MVTAETLCALCDITPKGKVLMKKNQRPLYPDEFDKTVTIYDPLTRKRRKLLYKKLCWILYNRKEVPEDKSVLQLDLKEDNFSINNLRLVDKKDYASLMLALRNLSGSLKVLPHTSNRHKYVVHWLERGKHMKIVTQDFVAAEQLHLQKKQEFVKIVNKYILTE
jgi:hypothetical protein